MQKISKEHDDLLNELEYHNKLRDQQMLIEEQRGNLMAVDMNNDEKEAIHMQV